MLLDAQTRLSNEQAITASAASENYIDLGADHAYIQDLNEKMAELLVQVTEDFATLTSLQVILQEDDDSAFGTAVDVLTSEDIAVADLLAGKRIRMGKALPLISKRYIRLYYTVTGSNATAGKIFAGLVLNSQTNRSK